MFVRIPWQRHVEKLPDPAAAELLSDYRSERLHAVELAHSETPTHQHARKCRNTSTQTGMQHKIRRSLKTHGHKHTDKSNGGWREMNVKQQPLCAEDKHVRGGQHYRERQRESLSLVAHHTNPQTVNFATTFFFFKSHK